MSAGEPEAGRRYVSPCCSATALPTPSGRYYCMRCTKTVAEAEVTQAPEPDPAAAAPAHVPPPRCRPEHQAEVAPTQMTLF